MGTFKWGLTDDMMYMKIGSTTVAGLRSGTIRPTSDDSEVFVCGQRKPWKVVPGKQHFAGEAAGLLLDKETYYDRFAGATNAFSKGVEYPSYFDVVFEGQNPYVGSSTAHNLQYTLSECLLNEPEIAFSQGDGIIEQKITFMCEDLSVVEVEPVGA